MSPISCRNLRFFWNGIGISFTYRIKRKQLIAYVPAQQMGLEAWFGECLVVDCRCLDRARIRTCLHWDRRKAEGPALEATGASADKGSRTSRTGSRPHRRRSRREDRRGGLYCRKLRCLHPCISFCCTPQTTFQKTQ